MAYIEYELNNARLLWTRVRERVLIVGLIMLAMLLASAISAVFGHMPHKL